MKTYLGITFGFQAEDTMRIIVIIVIIAALSPAAYAGWNEPVQISSNLITRPSIAMSGNYVHIMGVNYYNHSIEYLRGSYNGQSWDTPTQFVNPLRRADYVRLALRDSVVCAVWDDGTRTFMGYSSNNGQFWRFKYDILRYWYDTLWGLSPGLIEYRPYIMCNRMLPFEEGEEINFNAENIGDTTWGNPVSVYPIDIGADINTAYNQGIIHCLSWYSPNWRDMTMKAYYLKSTDLGYTWYTPVNIRPDSMASAWSPKLTINERGELIACYMDATQYQPYDSSAIVYRISYDNGLTWSDETQVNVLNWINELNIGWSGNTIAIAYRALSAQGMPSEVYCIISTDNGISWQPEFRLTSDSANTLYPGVAVSNDTVNVIYYSDAQPGVIDRGLYFRRYDPEPQGINDSPPTPSKLNLTAYPNPFNSSCYIKFAIPEPAHVLIDVYNILGQKVATLLNEQQQAGEHTVVFDASNLGSGLYFYRLNAGEYSETKSLVLIK
jgi:hypothetical protein